MELAEARRIMNPLVRKGEKITPELTNDWILSVFDNWSGTSRVFINSIILNLQIDISSTGNFLKEHVFTSGLTLDKDKIIGNYAFGTQGFISEDDFLKAHDLIEESKEHTPFKKRELVEGNVYRADDNNYYLVLGSLQDTFLEYKDSTLFKRDNILKSDKEIFIIKVNYKDFSPADTDYILYETKSIKFSPRIRLIEEIDSVKEENLYKIKFNAIRERTWTKYYPFLNKTIIKEKNGKVDDRFVYFQNSYYFLEKTIRPDQMHLAQPINKTRSVLNSFKMGYREVKDINLILEFLKNNSLTELEIFLSDTLYYFEDDDNLEIKKVSFT